MRYALLYLFLSMPGLANPPDTVNSVAACVEKLSVVPAVAELQVRMFLEGGVPAGSVNAVGGCVKSSSQLAQRLRDGGFPALRIRVANSTPIRVGARLEKDIETYHYFVSIPLSGGKELLVDGTYRQFVHRGADALEPIFIGTREELVAVFDDERERLQFSALGDGRGLLDPEAFVDKVYGYGAAASSREVVPISTDVR